MLTYKGHALKNTPSAPQMLFKTFIRLSHAHNSHARMASKKLFIENLMSLIPPKSAGAASVKVSIAK
jgi:hypothetical protein